MWTRSAQSGATHKKAACVGQFAFSFYLLLCFTASLISPATLWAEPLALSNLPSVCNFLSSVTLTAVSLMAPFALSAVPLTCSRSMLGTLHFVLGFVLGPSGENQCRGLKVRFRVKPNKVASM